MKYKGAIFDLDGTLVDSIEDLANSMNSVLHLHNFPTHSISKYKIFLGKGILNLVTLSVPESERNEQTIQKCFTQMIDTYRNNCTINTKSYEGILDLLKELTSRNVKLAVLSNKADEFTKKIVHTLFPGYFDFVVGLTSEETKKPNPAVTLQISENWGIAPDDIAFIGDTSIDMQTAINTKMHPVGVLWGFRTEEELKNSGAEIILTHPMDLIKFL